MCVYCTLLLVAVAGDRERDEGSDDELSSNDDVESLQNKLSDYRDIIKRQEELLQVRIILTNTSSYHIRTYHIRTIYSTYTTRTHHLITMETTVVLAHRITL